MDRYKVLTFRFCKMQMRKKKRNFCQVSKYRKLNVYKNYGSVELCCIPIICIIVYEGKFTRLIYNLKNNSNYLTILLFQKIAAFAEILLENVLRDYDK
jgi:hypothetical protein